jgi:hypothetical protein
VNIYWCIPKLQLLCFSEKNAEENEKLCVGKLREFL